jgi:tetratricopeptide (TPR) repeat protein
MNRRGIVMAGLKRQGRAAESGGRDFLAPAPAIPDFREIMPPRKSSSPVSGSLNGASLVLGAAVLALWAGPVSATAVRDLATCSRLAGTRPDQGMQEALAWQKAGGGDHARLCQALALFHRGDFPGAARRFEELAPLLGKNAPPMAASLLDRAGLAWLRAGNASGAERLFTAAIALQPGDADLLIDRAVGRAQAKRFREALADLDAALAKDAGRADALLYRAAAHNELGNGDQAIADADRALAIRPNDGEVLLLHGNIRMRSGDMTGAREDWTLAAQQSADPVSARAARHNLDRLDAAAVPADRKPAAPGVAPGAKARP